MTQPFGIGFVDGPGVVPRTFAWSGEPSGDRMRWFADGLRSVMLDQGYTEVEQAGSRRGCRAALRRPGGGRGRIGARTRRPSSSRWPSCRRHPTTSLRDGLSAARAGAGQPVRDGEPDWRRLRRRLRHPRARHVRRRHERRRRPVLLQDGVLARRATRDVAPGDRQRVHSRPARRALRGRRITRQITRAGERLGALDLLPAAFPIEEILSARGSAARQAALRHRRAELRQRQCASQRRGPASRSRSTG